MELEDSKRCKRRGGGGWRCHLERYGRNHCLKHHVEEERRKEKKRKDKENLSKDEPTSIVQKYKGKKNQKPKGQAKIEAAPVLVATRKNRGRKRKPMNFADTPDSILGKEKLNQLKGVNYIDLDLAEDDQDTEATPNENQECFLQMRKEGDDDKDIDPAIRSYILHKAREMTEAVNKSISANVDHLKDIIFEEMIQCSSETPSDKKITPFFKRCLEQWKFKYISSLIESYSTQSKGSLNTEIFKIGEITLRREDLATLSPTVCLSAGVMGAYETIIKEISKSCSKDGTPTVHIVQPYISPNLKNGYNLQFSDALEDLASCHTMQAKILIPVTLCESHWGLIIVDFNEVTITVLDSKFSNYEATKKYKDIVKVVERHLPSEGKKWRMIFPENLPKHYNDYDCGLFVLAYMECIARGFSIDFDMDVSSSRVVIFSDMLDYILKGE